MSRVGKKPIPIPDKTKISYSHEERLVTVQGKRGTLVKSIPSSVDLRIEGGIVSVTTTDSDRVSRSLQGLARSIVANMITGVNKGFERVLIITGIGYRATLEGSTIVFNLGHSHPVNFDLPVGILASIDKNNVIKLFGADKEKLGLAAAAIRRLRPPGPYKDKGIKYAGEYIHRKAGKSGAK